jgi:hypothetical protein
MTSKSPNIKMHYNLENLNQSNTIMEKNIPSHAQSNNLKNMDLESIYILPFLDP